MFLSGLDDIDRRLVELLIHNARMSYSDLGQAVGLSRVAVKARVRALEERGVIEAPIARKEGSVIERQVDFQRGEYARTEYETLAYSGEADCSLVRLHLLTGRTHQIRVHMKYAGHPLLGDFLYHPDMRRIGRQALHAWKLELDHPMSGEHLEITAPVPEDFLEVMRELHLNI